MSCPSTQTLCPALSAELVTLFLLPFPLLWYHGWQSLHPASTSKDVSSTWIILVSSLVVLDLGQVTSKGKIGLQLPGGIYQTPFLCIFEIQSMVYFLCPSPEAALDCPFMYDQTLSLTLVVVNFLSGKGIKFAIFRWKIMSPSLVSNSGSESIQHVAGGKHRACFFLLFAAFLQTSVIFYRSIWCYTPEDNNIM